MIEEKEALGKAELIQQVLVPDENTDFSHNVAHSPCFKDASLLLTSSAIQKALRKYTSSLKD
jgi:hypothetical protein